MNIVPFMALASNIRCSLLPHTKIPSYYFKPYFDGKLKGYTLQCCPRDMVFSKKFCSCVPFMQETQKKSIVPSLAPPQHAFRKQYTAKPHIVHKLPKKNEKHQQGVKYKFGKQVPKGFKSDIHNKIPAQSMGRIRIKQSVDPFQGQKINKNIFDKTQNLFQKRKKFRFFTRQKIVHPLNQHIEPKFHKQPFLPVSSIDSKISLENTKMDLVHNTIGSRLHGSNFKSKIPVVGQLNPQPPLKSNKDNSNSIQVTDTGGPGNHGNTVSRTNEQFQAHNFGNGGAPKQEHFNSFGNGGILQPHGGSSTSSNIDAFRGIGINIGENSQTSGLDLGLRPGSQNTEGLLGNILNGQNQGGPGSDVFVIDTNNRFPNAGDNSFNVNNLVPNFGSESGDNLFGINPGELLPGLTSGTTPSFDMTGSVSNNDNFGNQFTTFGPVNSLNVGGVNVGLTGTGILSNDQGNILQVPDNSIKADNSLSILTVNGGGSGNLKTPFGPAQAQQGQISGNQKQTNGVSETDIRALPEIGFRMKEVKPMKKVVSTFQPFKKKQREKSSNEPKNHILFSGFQEKTGMNSQTGSVGIPFIDPTMASKSVVIKSASIADIQVGSKSDPLGGTGNVAIRKITPMGGNKNQMHNSTEIKVEKTVIFSKTSEIPTANLQHQVLPSLPPQSNLPISLKKVRFDLDPTDTTLLLKQKPISDLKNSRVLPDSITSTKQVKINSAGIGQNMINGGKGQISINEGNGKGGIDGGKGQIVISGGKGKIAITGRKGQIATEIQKLKTELEKSDRHTMVYTESLPIDICHGCKMDGGVGYTNHPTSCDRFIVCYPVDGGVMRPVTQLCPYGLFWSQSALTCKLSRDVFCPHEICKFQADKYQYASKHSCRSFWECQGGKSLPKCCPWGYSFLDGIGCIEDPACEIPDIACSIDPRDYVIEWGGICDKRPISGVNGIYERRKGKQWIQEHCPSGWSYQIELCECTKISELEPPTYNFDGQTCVPEVYLPFTNSFSDLSGNNVYVRVDNASLTSGAACFDGKSALAVPAFANMDYGDSFYLHVRYKQRDPGNNMQALVFNGDCEKRHTFMLGTKSSGNYLSLHSNLHDEKKLWVNSKRKVTDWRDVWVKFERDELFLQSNDNTQMTPLTGAIARSECGMKIGWGKGVDNFVGCIDEISIHRCQPAKPMV